MSQDLGRDALSRKALSQNALGQKALSQNALSQKALNQNSLSQTALSQNGYSSRPGAMTSHRKSTSLCSVPAQAEEELAVPEAATFPYDVPSIRSDQITCMTSQRRFRGNPGRGLEDASGRMNAYVHRRSCMWRAWLASSSGAFVHHGREHACMPCIIVRCMRASAAPHATQCLRIRVHVVGVRARACVCVCDAPRVPWSKSCLWPSFEQGAVLGSRKNLHPNTCGQV